MLITVTLQGGMNRRHPILKIRWRQKRRELSLEDREVVAKLDQMK